MNKSRALKSTSVNVRAAIVDIVRAATLVTFDNIGIMFADIKRELYAKGIMLSENAIKKHIHELINDENIIEYKGHRQHAYFYRIHPDRLKPINVEVYDLGKGVKHIRGSSFSGIIFNLLKFQTPKFNIHISNNNQFLIVSTFYTKKMRLGHKIIIAVKLYDTKNNYNPSIGTRINIIQKDTENALKAITNKKGIAKVIIKNIGVGKYSYEIKPNID